MKKSNHSVYFFKSNLMAKIRNNEYPIYKIGYSTNVHNRKYQFTIPFDLELLEFVEFPNRESALIVERMLLEYPYPTHRLLGTRQRRRTEWIYLNDDEADHILENLRQFKDPKIVNKLQFDIKTIEKELNSAGGDFINFIKQWKIELDKPSLYLIPDNA